MGESQPKFDTSVLTFADWGAAGTAVVLHRAGKDKQDIALFTPEQRTVAEVLQFLAAFPGSVSLIAVRTLDAVPLPVDLDESEESYAYVCLQVLITEMQGMAHTLATDAEGLARYFQIIFLLDTVAQDLGLDWRQQYERRREETRGGSEARFQLESTTPVRFVFHVGVDRSIPLHAESDSAADAEFLIVQNKRVKLEPAMAQMIRTLQLQRSQYRSAEGDESTNQVSPELTALQVCELLGEVCPEHEAEKWVWEVFNTFRTACAEAGYPHFSQMIRYRIDVANHRTFFSLGEAFISQEELPQVAQEHPYYLLKLPA